MMQPLGLHQPLGSTVPLGQREQRFVRSPLGHFTSPTHSPHIQRLPTLGQRLQADFLQRSEYSADIVAGLPSSELTDSGLPNPDLSNPGLADLLDVNTASTSVQMSPDSATSLPGRSTPSKGAVTRTALTPEIDAPSSWNQLKPLSRQPLATPPKALTPQNIVPEIVPERIQTRVQTQIQAQIQTQPVSRSRVQPPSFPSNTSQSAAVDSLELDTSEAPDTISALIENPSDIDVQHRATEDAQESQQKSEQGDRINPIDLTDPIEKINSPSTSSLPAVPEPIASDPPPQPLQPQLFPLQSPQTEAPQPGIQPQIQPQQPESSPEILQARPTTEPQTESQSILSDSPEVNSTQSVIQQQTQSDSQTLLDSKTEQEQEQLVKPTESLKSSEFLPQTDLPQTDLPQTEISQTEISFTTTTRPISTHSPSIQLEAEGESNGEHQETLAAIDDSLASPFQSSTVESETEITPTTQLREITTGSTDFLMPISSNEDLSASEPQKPVELLVEPSPELESNNQTESVVQFRLERSPLQRNTTQDNNLEPQEASLWNTGNQRPEQAAKESVPQIEARSSGFISSKPVEQASAKQPEIQSVLQAPIQPLNEEPAAIDQDSTLQAKNDSELDEIAVPGSERIQNRFDRSAFQQRQPLGRIQPLATPTPIMPKLDQQSTAEGKSSPSMVGAPSASSLTSSPPKRSTISPTSVVTPDAWSSIEDLIGKSGLPSSQPWEQEFNLQSPLGEDLVSPIATNTIQAPTNQSGEMQSQYTLSNYGVNLKQPGTKNKIDDEKLEWLAHIIYGSIRDRLVIDRERHRYTAATHPPWTDTLDPNFFKPTTLTSQTNAPDTQQQPISTRYPPSRPLETLIQEMYKRMQFRLEQDKERQGNNNYKRPFT